jgi:hypothetical protein
VTERVIDLTDGESNMENDLISRHGVSAWLDNMGYPRLADAIMDENRFPSAQPERKRGKWIYNSPVTMKCDQCGLVIKDWDWHRFKFCPNCDCDMRGEENG